MCTAENPGEAKIKSFCYWVQCCSSAKVFKMFDNLSSFFLQMKYNYFSSCNLNWVPFIYYLFSSFSHLNTYMIYKILKKVNFCDIFFLFQISTESMTCTRPNAVSILDALKFASADFDKNFTLFSCLIILTNSPPRVRIWKKELDDR